jgi:hypothetical protein
MLLYIVRHTVTYYSTIHLLHAVKTLCNCRRGNPRNYILTPMKPATYTPCLRTMSCFAWEKNLKIKWHTVLEFQHIFSLLRMFNYICLYNQMYVLKNLNSYMILLYTHAVHVVKTTTPLNTKNIWIHMYSVQFSC